MRVKVFCRVRESGTTASSPALHVVSATQIRAPRSARAIHRVLSPSPLRWPHEHAAEAGVALSPASLSGVSFSHPVTPAAIAVAATTALSSVAVNVASGEHAESAAATRGSALTHMFRLDGVLTGPRATQAAVYAQTTAALVVDLLMHGRSGSVMCCGPCASGKSYTMWGGAGRDTSAKKMEAASDHPARGIAARALEKLFARVEQSDDDRNYRIVLTMLQLVDGERVVDLLAGYDETGGMSSKMHSGGGAAAAAAANCNGRVNRDCTDASNSDIYPIEQQQQQQQQQQQRSRLLSVRGQPVASRASPPSAAATALRPTIALNGRGKTDLRHVRAVRCTSATTALGVLLCGLQASRASDPQPSHRILSIHVCVTRSVHAHATTGTTMESTLHLVDLAGPQCVEDRPTAGKGGGTHSKRSEAWRVNRSLATLERVMTRLQTGARGRRRARHRLSAYRSTSLAEYHRDDEDRRRSRSSSTLEDKCDDPDDTDAEEEEEEEEKEDDGSDCAVASACHTLPSNRTPTASARTHRYPAALSPSSLLLDPHDNHYSRHSRQDNHYSYYPGSKKACAASASVGCAALPRCHTMMARAAPAPPFRDSKLTMLLKDCLGARCFATLIAHVCVHPPHLESTLATLNFVCGVRTRARRPGRACHTEEEEEGEEEEGRAAHTRSSDHDDDHHGGSRSARAKTVRVVCNEASTGTSRRRVVGGAGGHTRHICPRHAVCSVHAPSIAAASRRAATTHTNRRRTRTMTSSTADCVTERNTSDGDENCASLAKSTRQRGGSGSGSGSGSGGGGGGGGGVGDETARGARQTASRRGQTSSPPPPTVPGSNDGMEDRRKTAATATTAAAPPIPTWSALPVLYTPSRLDRSAGVAFGTGSPCVHAGNRAPTNNHDNSIHEDEDEDGDVGRCSMSALESPTCCGGQSKNSIDTTTIADAISTRDHKSGSDTNRTGCQDDTSADVACRADVPDGGADARSGRGDARTCHLCLHVQETKEKPTRRGRTWRYSPMAHDVAATTSDGDCQLHCHDLCDASRRNDVLLQQSTRLLLERRRTAQSRNLQNRFEEYARTRCGSRLVRLLTADERLLTEREIELQQQQHGHGHESPSHDDARLSSGVDGYLHGSVLSRTRTCAPPANLTVMQSECAALRSQIHRQRAALYDNFHAWYASLLSNDRQGSAESTVNANEDMDHDERVKKKPVMIIT